MARTDYPDPAIVSSDFVAIQRGVLSVQEGVLKLFQQAPPSPDSPLWQAATEIQRGAAAILKGALALQEQAIEAATATMSVADRPDLDNRLNRSFLEAERLKLEGDAHLNKSAPGDAIRLYNQALGLRSPYPEAEHNLAIALLNRGRYREAETILKSLFFLERDLPLDMKRRFAPTVQFDDIGELPAASPFKVQDRIEQLTYLIETGRLDESFTELITRLNDVKDELARDAQRTPYAPLTRTQVAKLGGYFDKSIYYADSPRIDGPAVNDKLDWGAIEAEYKRTRCVHFDDLLSENCLARLRQYFVESMVFNRFSEAGFVASYVTDGFNCGLIFQVIEELHERLPHLLADRHLNNMWCYRYGASGPGVRPHNGDGSVTINFYLTPDSSNLDPSGGGMVMYDKEHPADWDWLKYNMNKDDPLIQDDIAKYLADATATKVPYRCNRAVLFHSTLFHKTDPFNFRDGYSNRRMNITMLFGKRGQESALIQ